jgi:hypothetical protein
MSCSHPSKDIPSLPDEIANQEVNQCLNYKKNVLEMAFDSRPEFASNILEQFDLAQGFKQEKQQLIKGILGSCDSQRIKIFNSNFKQISRCDLGFSELTFFQKAVEKMRKRQWPLEMDLEAKRQAIQYITYFSDQRHHSLLDRLIALSILDELSAYSIVSQSLHPEIKKILLEAQDFIFHLEKQVLKNKELNCENLDTLEQEIKYSQEVGHKLKRLLQRI